MPRLSKPLLHDQKASIQLMERFSSLPIKHSFLGGRQEQFNKMLIFSAQTKYPKRDDFPSKIFRRKNIVYICVSYDEYYAIDLVADRKVGYVLMQNDWLHDIEVDSSYRRQGIATNLMKALVKTIKNDFHVPAEGCRQLHSYYLTEDGAALISSCIRKGIISQEQCLLEPPQTPSRSP